jgi:hypothetical protein
MKIDKHLIFTIVIGTLIAMASSLSATVIMAVIALWVEIEDPERFSFKIGFVAASVYWLVFFFYMYHQLTKNDGTDKETN